MNTKLIETTGLSHVIGKPVDDKTNYGTCYPVVDKNNIVIDIVCSEFGSIDENGRLWETDGNTARFINGK